MYYTSLFIITRFQNSLPSCCFIISWYMYPLLLHKMAPFCMNTAKKISGWGPLDPPSNKTLLDPIIHINTDKISIKQNRENTKGYSKSIVRRKITTSSEKDWSQQVEHMQAPKGRDQVSGGVIVPCRHATPIADAQWKPIFSYVKFSKKSNLGKGHELVV